MCSAYRWSYWKQGTTDESSKNDASFIVSQISGWSKSKNPIWIPNDIKSWLLKLDIEKLWRIKKRLKVGNLENQNLRPYCFFALGFVPLILVDDGPPLLPPSLMVQIFIVSSQNRRIFAKFQLFWWSMIDLLIRHTTVVISLIPHVLLSHDNSLFPYYLMENCIQKN